MQDTLKASDVFERARNHDRVEQLRFARENDLFPYFRELESMPGPITVMEGRERLMLGSNNYLGLTEDQRVQDAAKDAVDTFGTGLTGSRLLNGTTSMHVSLERELAQWHGEEEALVFSTGYLTNLGVIGSLTGPGDTVVCDRYNHASIFDACQLSGANVRRYQHSDMASLESELEHSSSGPGATLVVVDSVFSMEGDICPLDRVVELCQRYGARLMVDEAHALGVFGERGTGLVELFGLEREVDLRMGTFSKSLASCGGFIAGPSDVIDYMRIFSRPLLFTAAAVPAAVAAAHEAVRICRSKEGPRLFSSVLNNAKYLSQGLAQLGFKIGQPADVTGHGLITTPVIPVIIGDDIQAIAFWKTLYDGGLYANVALYPAVPRDGALIRTSVMATHTRDQLDLALEVFAGTKEKFPHLAEG